MISLIHPIPLSLDGNPPMIELYQFESCPFCQKVRTFCSQKSIDFISRSCEKDSPNRAKLVALGGKQQVPFLHDPKRQIALYESDAIIDYLRQHYV